MRYLFPGFKRILSFLILCFSLTSINAQTTVTGKVTDDKGDPVPNVSIVKKGTSKGVTTTADGSFSISVTDANTVLVFSSVGYDAQQVTAGTQKVIDIQLKSNANSRLNEVVVTGYGTARKRDITGAVASITTKDFNKGVINSADQLLQNKVAGLEVTNTSGQPGAATTVQIRGSSSIRAGASPLYVVDGVPLDGATARPNTGTAFGNTPNSNPLLFINPYDIAQIDVLKDASSTAIYGSRGANGVIIISTKKGGSGPMKVDVGVNVGAFAGYMKRFNILDRSQYLAATKKYLPDSVSSKLNYGDDVDALKEITQNTITQNYSVALSGGNENGKFRASFLASDNQGFIKKSSLTKYLASFNGQYNYLDNKLNIEFGLIAANVSESLVPVGNAGSQGNLISSALSWNPTQPFKVNGLYNYPSSGSNNPLALSAAFSDKSNLSEFLAHISATYKILPQLQYKFLYGINYGTGGRLVNTQGWIKGLNGVSGQGVGAILNQKLTTEVFDHTLSYQTKLAKNLSVDALVGYEYYKVNLSGGGASASGFNTNLDESNIIDIPYTNIFQDAKTQNPYSTFANPTAELQSYFARATFNYQDKYILTGTVRSDGSSKFGSNNRYSYFPSGAFKWQINNESFMKNSTLFANLGLRVSYGVTGNQEFPAGASREQFAFSSFNSTPQVVNGNPDLKWETTKQFNAGVDFAFGKGNIYGSIDYYDKNTSDILFATTAIQPAPSSTSYINLQDAHLKNSGIEVSVGATIVQNAKITWDINANLAYNKNKVTNFTDPNTGRNLLINTGTIDGQGVSGTLAQVFTNNQPVNVFYLKQFGGYDAKGNQIIGADPIFAGDPNPAYLAGFSTSVRYRKVVVSINMGGSFGFKLYNNTATSVTNISGIAQGRNIDENAYNSNEKPSSIVGASTRFLENGNYWKLRNATVTYNLGSVGKYVKNVSAYVSGSNLFVITKFTGFDPEVNIDKSNNGYPSRSIEYIPFPTPRTITLGLNFSL